MEIEAMAGAVKAGRTASVGWSIVGWDGSEVLVLRTISFRFVEQAESIINARIWIKKKSLRFILLIFSTSDEQEKYDLPPHTLHLCSKGN